MRNHFAGIDILRFFAALMVAVYHLAYVSWAFAGSTSAMVSGSPFQFELLNEYASVGWVGVEIFFVISGFVITYSATGTSWQFLRSRILRLVPAAWICASISVIILATLKTYPGPELIKRFLKSATFYPWEPYVDGVYWTLSIEISFYFIVYLVMTFDLKNHSDKILYFIGIISSFYIALQYFGIFVDENRNLRLLLLPHGVFFSIGSLIYSYISKEKFFKLFMIWIFSGFGFLKIYHDSLIAGNGVISESAIVHGSPFIVPFIWVCATVFLYFGVRLGTPAKDSLTSRISRSLGLATYPLYLIHNVVGAAILRSAAVLGLGRWLALTLAISSSIVFSILIASHIEPFLRSRLAHFLDSWRSAASLRK